MYVYVLLRYSPLKRPVLRAASSTSYRMSCLYGVLAGFLLACWSGIFSINTLHAKVNCLLYYIYSYLISCLVE